jgi:hypothetical protein
VSSVRSRRMIARLVTRGRPPADLECAQRVLVDLFDEKWPRNFQSTFLLMPGGFISVDWPVKWSGRFGWASRVTDADLLIERAAEAVVQMMSDDLRRRMADRVEVVAIGIDFVPDKATKAYAEIVALYDIKTRAVTFTGKSFPRSDQRTLVRVVDLSTHFMSIGGEHVLALGCHDLNIFSPRGRGVQKPDGPLQKLRKEMDERVRRFQPTVVLQLPHGTDTPNTWCAAWRALTANCMSIRAWASGISYFRMDESAPRATLAEVLAGTHGGDDCLDLICEVRPAHSQRLERRRGA